MSHRLLRARDETLALELGATPAKSSIVMGCNASRQAEAAENSSLRTSPRQAEAAETSSLGTSPRQAEAAAELEESCEEGAYEAEVSAHCKKPAATGLRNVYAHGRKFRAAISDGIVRRRYIGSFDTPEEAALAVAQHEVESLETLRRKRALEISAAALLATQQAAEEGLELRRSDRSKTGYLGVYVYAFEHGVRGSRLLGFPEYRARDTRAAEGQWLGTYCTPEEAALAVARHEAQRPDDGRPASQRLNYDPELPGWRVVLFGNASGRRWKVYYGPNGERLDSRRAAVLACTTSRAIPAAAPDDGIGTSGKRPRTSDRPVVERVGVDCPACVGKHRAHVCGKASKRQDSA